MTGQKRLDRIAAAIAEVGPMVQKGGANWNWRA